MKTRPPKRKDVGSNPARCVTQKSPGLSNILGFCYIRFYVCFGVRNLRLPTFCLLSLKNPPKIGYWGGRICAGLKIKKPADLMADGLIKRRSRTNPATSSALREVTPQLIIIICGLMRKVKLGRSPVSPTFYSS